MVEIAYPVIVIVVVLIAFSIFLTIQTRWVVSQYITKDREKTLKALQTADEQYAKLFDSVKEWAKGVDEGCHNTQEFCKSVKGYIDNTSKLTNQCISTALTQSEELSRLRKKLDTLIFNEVEEAIKQDKESRNEQ